jgi:hypothetical protein
VNAQVSVCLMVGQQQMREMKWGINTSPQKTRRCCAFTAFLSTSDPRSVLPTGAGKLTSKAISVLLTQGQYYRGPGENSPVNPYRYYRQ